MGSGFGFWLMCYFYSMYARKIAGRDFRVKPIFGMPILAGSEGQAERDA